MTFSATFEVESTGPDGIVAKQTGGSGISNAKLIFGYDGETINVGDIVYASGHIQKGTENGLPEGLEKVSRQSLTEDVPEPTDSATAVVDQKADDS